MDAMRGIRALALFVSPRNWEKEARRHAFLLGMARIPHFAKSVCSDGTSIYWAIENQRSAKSPQQKA
jgi:hypothetical protein